MSVVEWSRGATVEWESHGGRIAVVTTALVYRTIQTQKLRKKSKLIVTFYIRPTSRRPPLPRFLRCIGSRLVVSVVKKPAPPKEVRNAKLKFELNAVYTPEIYSQASHFRPAGHRD